MIQAFLNAAALEINLTVWGAKADQGTYYLAAHDLCLSPYGQNAKQSLIKGKDGFEATIYGLKYKLIFPP